MHIFSERARQYYDLERLWRNAERIDVKEEAQPDRRGGSESQAGSRSPDSPHAESEGNAAR